MIPQVGPGNPYWVRQAEPPDIDRIVPWLRPWDIVECLALGRDPATTIMEAFSAGYGPTTWTLIEATTPIAIGGIVPLPGKNLVWLLCANEFDKAAPRLLRYARRLVKHLRKEYGPLENVVPANADETRQWLQWLGFDFDPGFVHFSGVRFVRFRMR